MLFFRKRYIESQSDLARARKTLCEIKTALIKHVEDRGWGWVDHGTDDRDRICFELKDRYIGISTSHWDIDGKIAPLSELLGLVG